jgi:hypothetical protein
MSKDKNSLTTRIDSYGVKFYDVLSQTLLEIIQETKSKDDSISVCLTSDFYLNSACPKSMKAKEKLDYMQSDFEDACQKQGINPANYDVRFLLSDDPVDISQNKVICMGVGKVELTNLWAALSQYKFESITAIGSTITNLLPNKGAGQNCLIINIEDETKLTLIKDGQIFDLIAIEVGMDEVITQLAESYNSYAKAYAACKGIDAYSTTDVSLDSDSKMIREALMPVLYDLKTRIATAIEPYIDDFSEVYISGTGIIVNNIDLYLSEVFKGKKVELLVPAFVNRDRNNLKDVLEVNSALATAYLCLTGVNKDEDYLLSGTTLKNEVTKKRFSPKAIFTNVKEKVEELNKKTLKTRKSKKKKKDIQVDGMEQLGQVGGSGEFNLQEEEEEEYYDPMAEWFVRIAISIAVAWVAYTIVTFFITSNINGKIRTIEENKMKTEFAINQVTYDRTEIEKKKNNYQNKVAKLKDVINRAKIKRERSYNVPNFMSQLMFIIPIDVKVTSISVGSVDNKVILEAESGRYAQLGYFVSRLKLAGILKDVTMDVVDMSSNIKIKVNGVLP